MAQTKLRRSLSLPLLVFYGLGVTVGAGIFALIGEILALAGDAAPMAFMIAGITAGATGLSYALLVSIFPKAGGEAVFVNRGLGPAFGRLAGIGVAITGVISSAAIALAFAGYAGTLLQLPQEVLVVGVIALLSLLAWWGVRESVIFATVITIVEVGALLVIITIGLPSLANLPPVIEISGFNGGLAGFFPVMSAGLIAFFAFVGFEDIENMAEETVDPSRTSPRAIFWTLGLTVVIYLALSLVAVSVTDRAALTDSPAPLAVLFEQITGLSGNTISAIASIAMVNGILVQIIMSARVLYGMANENLVPAWFAKVDARHQTPARATFFVAVIIVALALALPLVRLAEITSLVILVVFALVNLSLFTLGGRPQYRELRGWRWWGLFAAALCFAILALHLFSGLQPAH